MAEKLYRVKGLEWVGDDAQTPFGTYTLYHHPNPGDHDRYAAVYQREGGPMLHLNTEAVTRPEGMRLAEAHYLASLPIEEVKVLGELPKTGDGCYIGVGAFVWVAPPHCANPEGFGASGKLEGAMEFRERAVAALRDRADRLRREAEELRERGDKTTCGVLRYQGSVLYSIADDLESLPLTPDPVTETKEK